MSEEGQGVIRSLQPVYRTGPQGLSKEFFEPCLRFADRYWRAAGYFSSSALRSWGAALVRVVRNELTVRLLISPELSEHDAKALRAAVDDRVRRAVLETASDRLVTDALDLYAGREVGDVRARLLTWMIAAGRLELRFAVPRHLADAGIFHEKSGLFSFPWGDRVAFSGSPNETDHGYVKNYEKIHVFRSWVDGDTARVAATEEDFERQWDGREEALIVAPLSTKALELIKERAPTKRPDFDDSTLPAARRWRHQDEAVDSFLQAGRGILEMATGTGKTRTALMILSALFRAARIRGAIVTTDGTDLLDQWFKTLVTSEVIAERRLRVLRQYAGNHQSTSFANHPLDAIIVISRQQLPALVSALPPEAMSSLLIVHDEVHGLGAPLTVKGLAGVHSRFAATLGLSATPEREYDEEGSQFIEDEIGPVIFRFGLKEAIERGILVEFDYVPLEYQLTEEDKRRLAMVYSRQAARKREGNPMRKEEVWTELARVYKTAEEKPLVFREYLAERPEILKNAILFVEEKAYGDRLLPMLHPYTHLYRTYYAEDDQQHLVEFSQGKIDCLVTCHRISQGIDIRRLRTVVLFASSRARLETIQRIGRCLRSDPSEPDKRALVVDFIRVEDGISAFESADKGRREWLEDLATTRRKE